MPQPQVRPRAVRAEHRRAAGAEPLPAIPREGYDAAPPRSPGRPSDVADALQPMLEAVVRFAGAIAGIVRSGAPDQQGLAPVAAVDASGAQDRHEVDAWAHWCSACAETGCRDRERVGRHLAGGGDHAAPDRVGAVCRHIVTVPLQHQGRPVGALDLLFAGPCDLPPAMPAMLQAVGDLVGVTLENARLTRESMRVALMSERQTMANEVHDSLAQGLTYMRMRMSLLSDAIRQRNELRAFKYWSDVDDALTHAHARLRELITCFRSRMDPRGLVHALEDTAEHFLDRTGIALNFMNRAPDFHLAAGREVDVYHVVQEALANVCRHAQAKHARITLDRMPAGYEITIEDDGVGIGAAARVWEESGHYGTAIMRERAQRLGGDVVTEPAAGAGTRVRLRFPAIEPQPESRT